jgi:hypothetical protein
VKFPPLTAIMPGADLSSLAESSSAYMHDALGNPLVIEARYLFAEVEILQQCRSAYADLKRVLIIADSKSLIGVHVITGPQGVRVG